MYVLMGELKACLYVRGAFNSKLITAKLRTVHLKCGYCGTHVSTDTLECISIVHSVGRAQFKCPSVPTEG